MSSVCRSDSSASEVIVRRERREMELYLVAILLGTSLPGLLAGPPVEVSPERIILLENRPLEVKCRVRQPIAYCRFDVPGIPDGLSLRPGIPPHQGIQYSGAGFDKGECGMLIQSVSSKNSGRIHCSMGFSSEPVESKGNMMLVVAKPPDPPILQLSPGASFGNAFREGEIIQANCRIVNARPVANISWYLGSEPIYERLSPLSVEEENGLMSVSQNMSRKVSYLDHGKDLKCVASHMALSQSNINHSIHKLDIRFPPKPKSQELEKFGFTIGKPGKIVVTFQANPIPVIVWKVDQDNLKQGTRDRTGRFEAGVLMHKGAGTWDATLIINTVRPEEVEKRYTLIAQNELGQESYKVAISTSPEPPADITAGTIVGIVIAVLVILLVIFILVFARATGRWCFAGGVPRPPKAESLPSYRRFLPGKPPNRPDKVSSLVYKDYTLVEHDDGTKAYVSPEDKARLLLRANLPAPTTNPCSDSDSEYEIPVSTPTHPQNSCPFAPGDNARINLPPYIVPLETTLTLPHKKKRDARAAPQSRFSLREPLWAREAEGDAQLGGRRGSSGGSSDTAQEAVSTPESGETAKGRRRAKKLDTNPLRKMFAKRAVRETGGAKDGEGRRLSSEDLGRYSDAALSEVQSDTESADHGSTDKSSVTKLTSDKQPKRLMSGLLGSLRKGKSKERAAEGDAGKNLSFEITVKEAEGAEGAEEAEQSEAVRAEGIVYAELDMARSPSSVMRREDEKTEYAEIIYPGTKAERAAEELRKSREKLSSSREQLTEVEEALSTAAEGKKEAAV